MELIYMSGNTFGHTFRITTWGESHGSGLGVVVDGVPAGLEIDSETIQKELNRRRPGQSKISTPRNESDKVEILSGIFEGKTTGTPISMMVRNKDADSSSYNSIKNIPRPGHADYSYLKKYDIRDYRGGGRSSARETLGRVAAGAIAKKLLATFGITIVAHVTELGGIKAKKMPFDKILTNIEKTPVRCADMDAADKMLELIDKLKEKLNSVGGMVEIIAMGVPAGIGEPVFDKLDADIAKAIMSIGAVKSVEIGVGIKAARMEGSKMNDSFTLKNGKFTSQTNNAGGILGGISTGMPIICSAGIKPTPSISQVQHTVNLEAMKDCNITIKGRHDPIIPPRMVPVAEAMMALVLSDHMIRSGRIHPNSLLK